MFSLYRDIKVLYGDRISSYKIKKPKGNPSKGKKQIEKEDTEISDEVIMIFKKIFKVFQDVLIMLISICSLL